MNLNLPISLGNRPRGTTYFVKGKAGYFQHRNGGVPAFLPYEARRHAPRFSLKQAEQLAIKCREAGHEVDVSVV